MSRAAIPNSMPRGSGPASAFVGAAGAALATLHVFFPDTLLPLLAGGTVMIFAACLAMMGIERFYDQPVRWREHRADHRLELRRPGFLHLRLRQHDDADPRLFVRPGAAVCAVAETAVVVDRTAATARAPGSPALSPIVIIALYALRAVGYLAHLGGEFSTVRSNPPQSVLMLVADVPVDGVEFRLPADGDRPAAQRGRRPRAARRSHRRRQPPASAGSACPRNAPAPSAATSLLRCW